ncbi:phage portal protein [Streptomyces sp. N2-109]|uniref:Phage portal protein n=1 Tax=Streptomyces gossypii TaxID=2883101 RepID=A0ABT2K233_9ACTN|nr:phage portal protein [Streptomyces gossypii]MCT2594222.1 phage portal protein [Streptomyces gossypii]
MADPTPEDLAQLGFDGIAKDRPRLDTIDDNIRGDQADPYIPQNASDLYLTLVQRCKTNILPLLVKTPAQTLAVDGYTRSDSNGSEEAPAEWVAWQDNRMDARQASVHRAALQYGQSYVTVLPKDGEDSVPVFRGVTPRLMHAAYTDPAADALPKWAFQLEQQQETEGVAVRGWLYDSTTVYELMVGGKKGPEVISSRPHGVQINGEPVCPVVRFAPDIDLEGRVTGVVEPMIVIQDRLNQTVFDLLVAQTFGSFKVRTVSGMAPEFRRDPETGEILVDTNGRPIAIPVRADASRLLMAPDADTKFNTLDETPLSGFLEAIDMAVKHMSVVSQTPPHYLLGSIINIGAEALAAAESALQRAVQEYKNALGESWETAMMIAASIQGGTPDPRAQVNWKDVESRSLVSTVDALGKAVQLLKVPPRAMWTRIPGVSSTDAEQWAQMQESDDPGLRMADAIASNTIPEVTDG